MKKLILALLFGFMSMSSFASGTSDTTLYHVVTSDDLKSYTASNTYEPESLSTEGYIHFSSKEDVVDVANKYYSDKEDLLLLEVALKGSDTNLKYDDEKPHYYAGLDLNLVVRTLTFTKNTKGLWQLP
jgi:uncharacterized protein (DUF952 family)